MSARDSRSAEAQGYRHLYNTTRWKGVTGIRARQLGAHPLCEACLKDKRVTPATICDHVDPKSKQMEATFFAGPFQSLCKPCHDSRKQQQERQGFSLDVGADGLPTDPNHPFNRA